MIEIKYTPSFIRLYKKLQEDLKQEVKEKINLFKNTKNHTSLKVHKLSGRMLSRHSFSVNYKIRIVFIYEEKNKNIVYLLEVGDHDIYR